jgi:hypothetical protein
MPIRKALGVLALSPLVAFAGWLIIQTKNESFVEVGITLFLVPIALWTLFAAIYLLILIHELGHLTIGKMVGFEFRQMIVGRVRISRKKCRLVLGESSGSWWDGFVFMTVPKALGQRWRFVFFVLGGIVFQGVFVAAVLGIVWARFPSEQARAGIDFLAVMLSSMTLASLVPFKHKGVPSDGLNLHLAYTKWTSCKRSFAMARLAISSQDLVPPEEWDEGDLQMLLEDESDSEMYAAGLLYQYYRSLHAGELDSARTWLETGLRYSKATTGAYYTFRLNAAIFFGWLQKDAPRALDAFAAVTPEMFPGSYAYLMARAAAKHAEGESLDVVSDASAALALIDSGSSTDSAYPYEREILLKMANKKEGSAYV